MIDKLFDGSFMPHGHCLLWQTDLLFLHVLGDVLTVVSYALIPLALVYLVHKRDDLAFNWIFLMFAAFIFLCGITHLLSVLNIWQGYYYLAGIFKLATGIVSILTALMIWKLIPSALAIPSNHQFKAKNEQLILAQQELVKSNMLLEQRVIERTQELELLAKTDALTGVLNRGGLMESISSEINRTVRYHCDFSLLMVDLDHFKFVNDNHGHQVGDQVLIETAEILNQACRNTDSLGRYGGEEFIILLPETLIDSASIIAERIRNSIEKHHFCNDSTESINLTCSIGVTAFHDTDDQVSLLRTVDKMLYQAKNSGRNKVVVNTIE
jgi:diguanylate cyclase (GGDEF)-like protein